MIPTVVIATMLYMATAMLFTPMLRQCCSGQGQRRQHSGRKSKLLKHNGLFLLYTKLDDAGEPKLRGWRTASTLRIYAAY